MCQLKSDNNANNSQLSIHIILREPGGVGGFSHQRKSACAHHLVDARNSAGKNEKQWGISLEV